MKKGHNSSCFNILFLFSLVWTIIFASYIFQQTHAQNHNMNIEKPKINVDKSSSTVINEEDGLLMNNMLNPMSNSKGINEKSYSGDKSHFRTTDIILVTTIDGAVHGIDRISGKPIWSQQDIWGPAVQAKDTSSNQNHHSYSNGSPLVSTPMSTYNNKNNSKIINNNLKVDDEEASNLKNIHKDGIYIPEPIGDGNLFHYIPGKAIKKLPLSLKTIVDEKPVYVSNDHIYTAKKLSRLAAINPFTGQIIRRFGDERQNHHHYQDPNIEGLAAHPNHIFLGRTDYVLVIQDTKNLKSKWNITYGEYTTSNPGDFVHDDNDGSLSSFGKINISIGVNGWIYYGEKDTTDNRQIIKWKTKLKSPVNNVFHVIRSSNFENPFTLTRVFPTKEHKNAERPEQNVAEAADEAYIGQLSGNFYVMSKKSFPSLFTESQRLLIDNTFSREDESGLAIICTPQSTRFPRCITGSHPLEDFYIRYPDDVYDLNQQPVQLLDPVPASLLLWSSSIGFYLSTALVTLITIVSTFTALLFKLSAPSSSSQNVPPLETKESVSTGINTDWIEVEANEEIENNATSLRFLKQSSLDSQIPIRDGGKSSVNSRQPSFTQIVLDGYRENKEHEGLNSLIVTDEVLGYGSHGTIVYKGLFEGRDVAVKRLLLEFYDVAHHEVAALQDSDHHPNVVRYYCREQTERFMYIALELCPASLFDIVEKPTTEELVKLKVHVKPKKVLFSIMQGIHNLHSMKIVHRDIKPQNILVAFSKSKSNPHPRVLISDFGLCKRLADDQSSFHNTIGGSGGTIGWRAPECMISGPATNPKDIIESSASDYPSQHKENNSNSSHSDSNVIKAVKITKKIDIFSAGCVFYYVLSFGDHPFGERFSREINILKGNYRLDKIDTKDEEGSEARDLIKRMIAKDPKKRPSSEEVLIHPYFWSSDKRLSFLQDVSDRFEIEERDPPSSLSKQLERNSNRIIGGDWQRKIDRQLLENIGKYRKYDTTMIRDLLRALRNKKHHYQDLPDRVKKIFGSTTDGLINYFTSKFPLLFMHVYTVVASNENLRNEYVFKLYFKVPENI